MNNTVKDYELLEIEVIKISEDVITSSGFFGEDVELTPTV